VKGACGPESFAFVPAGEFVMGSPEGELGREANEGPQRRVHVTHPYWLMATEVTQAEWREIMGTDPSYFSSCGDDCPVERVNWWDALLFCNALSAKHGLEPCYELTGCTGLDSPEGPTCTGVTVGAPGSNPLLCEGYRLSTEAEWEHARRAGTTTAFQRGGISHAEPDCEPDPALEDVAWYCPSSGGVTHAVKGKAPNGWGLFDMSGNVWEWVWDWYGVDYYSTRSVPDLDPLGPDTGSLRLLRGCSYENGAVHCRAAFRLTVEPDKRNVNVGLRPARTVLGTLSCASSADCDDSNACTADECREDGSCWHSPADCGDDDACTDVACDAATGCTYTPTDCDDSNPCTSDSCDSSAGCKHEALTDGTACDSGDGPGSGRCEKGACGPEGYLFVPAGELTMGSPEDEPGRDVAEGPRRRVHITTPFWLKTTEVTQAEWREVMNVGLFLFSPCGDDCPAEQVNFWDALSYCNALSEEHGLEPCYELEGCSGVDDPAGQTCTGVTVDTPGANPLLCEGYRLPTEAEWEYAYRAGTVTALYNGKLTNGEAGCGSDALADAIGWHCGNAESKTHPVMAKVPNAWGFFDMAGNVWEWAWDWYDPDYYSNRPDPDLDPVGSESGLNRILQGGSFTSPPLQCRAAYRFPGELVTRYGSVGLRPARSILSVASCTSPADCDDSNACTTDECREGSCWHLPRGCDDGNPCTDDSCDGATGCRHTNNAAPCDDGNACTGSSQCSQGVCVGADPVVCQPASQCHDAGVCDPDNGVCSNPAKQDGATCDDSEACTLTDVCDGGVCTGTNPKVCAALDQCHEPGTCDSVTGICSNPVKGDDAPCSDGDACSTSDTCKSGVCQPGPRIVCLASTDQCRDHGTCDAGIGVCVYPAKVEGTPCDDGNPCTTGDACTNGSCVGATAADCDDSNPCTVDSCDPSSGCKHEVLPDDTECDSGGGEASGRCRRGTCGPAGYVYVGPGTFMMGSPADELGRVADEAAHGVALTRGFWMKATEVTQAEWKQVMATEPSYFAECGGDCPVERVSWWDALAYCNALSLSEGLDRCYLVDGCAGAIGTGCAGGAESCVGSFSCAALSFVGPTCTGYRLPTEAEWEYAARAGTMTAVHSGDLTQTERAPLDPNLDAIAWYGGNSAVGYPGGAACSGWYVGSSTCGPHPVDEKRANDWGLKDTAGNIWEWVWDWYAVYAPGPVIDPLGAVAGSSRVFRGGSWLNTPVSSRAATRNGAFAPVYRGNGVGLRPVRTISDPPACAADADCDDANPCTVDACSESGRCWHVPNACDDGDSCTVDSCVSGVGCTHDEHQDGTACEITGASDTGVCLLGACKPNGYVRVPAGSFTMGSPETEPGREGHEGPQRTVQISRDYWLKQTEVTQGEWKALMGVANNPSLYTACGDDCPVEQVNWWEAVAYCNAMSSARGLDTCYVLSGCDADAPGHGMECAGVTVSAPGGDPLLCEGFRLPTEAEWERAYRAGTSTAFHNGALTYPECNPLDLRLTEIGWYCGNSEDTTNAVKGKTPNVWGFYDMAGNVWEWVWDRYDTSYYHGRPDPDVDPTGPDNAGGRILRGGSWGSGASTCRAAHRNRNNPESRVNRLGFRPARTVLPTSP